MGRSIFVNLPVADLDRAVAFFDRLGLGVDPRLTDDRAACLAVGEDAFVMLLAADFFRGFTRLPVADTDACAEVTVTLSATSRAEVDALVATALAHGGSAAGEPMDDFPMYGWSFKDPDGHHWELVHMDPAGLRAG